MTDYFVVLVLAAFIFIIFNLEKNNIVLPSVKAYSQSHFIKVGVFFPARLCINVKILVGGKDVSFMDFFFN